MDYETLPGTDIPAVKPETMEAFPRNIYDKLTAEDLHHTCNGKMLIETAIRGHFTDFDKYFIANNWPFDQKYREYVKEDNIDKAVERYIEVEKRTANGYGSHYMATADHLYNLGGHPWGD